ncbi:cytosolic carboxypeptidase 2-like [Physella acuta]|uniref:cytosolic carboxypeptidase 2-like n=1 Tax=Physella acuta TaxID=109671 RepID=UPI0027DB8EDE|nr:cytosolic carboxypeptidase 2-like [Physella acuta]
MGTEGRKRAEVQRESTMQLEERVRKMAEVKGMRMLEDEPRWREMVRQKMESDLSRRVREALETPPLERMQKRNQQAKQKEIEDLNAHLMIDLTEKERDYLRTKRWKALQLKKQESAEMSFTSQRNKPMDLLFRDELSRSNYDEYPGVLGLDNLSEGIKNIRDDYSVSVSRYMGAKPKARHFYTKEGFRKAVKSGHVPPGIQFLDEAGTYMDKYGVVRNNDGPFWPVECLPLFPTPTFKWWTDLSPEPLYTQLPENSRTIDTQTSYRGKWRGTQVAFDSERSARDYILLPVPEGCCPTLAFESRFECGNLRQARRIGQYEYELVLKADLFTVRHTQWYYFRVTNVVPGITYKFRIVNLLKRDSLYNHGMRPLVYSEKDAQEKQKGWVRTGHHISYSRNVTNHSCPLLQRGVTYFMLEWQMEFPNADDTYYLAHCYPYSFTDLKEDLEVLLNSEERSAVMKREVLCESRAGNSCFLLTVTNFNLEEEKKAVVISARVHPGESQASWMMKGLIEFISGPDPVAKELRDKFIFKIIPMTNPDGVIVGNYRCSLAARDLNRNYRHPRRENFPTVWHLKKLVEELSKTHEIALYCDLHGHSRKPNVFMYGNNTSADGDKTAIGTARAFIAERMFPWLMSVKSPEKFHFTSCKFSIRKCKESTGRVVMWRQMKIFNSFTLEATFSGTHIDRSNGRHFNILDFMEMGKVLAEVVLDYQKVQENKELHTATVRDLTRVVTRQILASKGLIEPETSSTDQVKEEERLLGQAGESTEKWSSALLSLLNTPRDTGDSGSNLTGEGKQTEQLYTKDDVMHMMDMMSGGQSIDDCLGFLAQLDVTDAIQESDYKEVKFFIHPVIDSSSDSDSESDAEMKPPDPKPRKKKKRTKKQRDKELLRNGITVSEKKTSEESKGKSLSALPLLTPVTRHAGSSAAPDSTDHHVVQLPQQANISSEKPKGRQFSGFISKYEGRHNGGMPCFTEERSLERAAKKIAENRKKLEDGDKDVSVLYVDEQGLQTIFEENLNQQLSRLNYGRPNSSTSGFNFRVGYTHADELQEINSGQPVTGANTYTSIAQPLPSYNYYNDQSSVDSHDNVDDNNNTTDKSIFPLTSKLNPYNLLEPITPRTQPTPSVTKYSQNPRMKIAISQVTSVNQVSTSALSSRTWGSHLGRSSPHYLTPIPSASLRSDTANENTDMRREIQIPTQTSQQVTSPTPRPSQAESGSYRNSNSQSDLSNNNVNYKQQSIDQIISQWSSSFNNLDPTVEKENAQKHSQLRSLSRNAPPITQNFLPTQLTRDKPLSAKDRSKRFMIE